MENFVNNSVKCKNVKNKNNIAGLRLLRIFSLKFSSNFTVLVISEKK